MANKQVVTKETVTTTDDKDEIALPGGAQAPAANESESADLAAMLELGMSPGMRWRVSCLSPADKAGECRTYSSDEISVDRIREEWGGGRYKIQGINEKNQFGRSAVITIKEMRAAPVAQLPPELAAVLQKLAAPQGAPDMTVFMSMMKQQSDLILALLSKQSTPPVDPVAMQKNFLESMVSMKAFMTPPKTEESVIDVLMKGLNLGKQIAGGGGEKDWTDVAMRGLEMIEPVIEEFAGRRGGAATEETEPAKLAAPVVPSRPAPAEPARAQSNEGGGMLQALQWLKTQTKSLCFQASRNKDPGLYAEVLLDNLPPFITPALLKDRLTSATAIDDLGKINPDVLKHREWFEKFRREIIVQLRPRPPAADAAPEGDAAAND